jgi:hypothetical protein
VVKLVSDWADPAPTVLNADTIYQTKEIDGNKEGC